ncbi:MAG: hypothetical protein PHZ18_07485, partial [Methanoculleus sp.]
RLAMGWKKQLPERQEREHRRCDSRWDGRSNCRNGRSGSTVGATRDGMEEATAGTAGAGAP